MYHEKTTHAARGKWRGILLNLGVPEACLYDKHGDCPLCGGKGKFRFDNREGRGTYICVCGAGDGLMLAMEFTGRSFKEVTAEIDAMLGNVKPDPNGMERQEMPEDKRRDLLRKVWQKTAPIEKGDPVDTYLTTRNLDELYYPAALRCAEKLSDGDGGLRPCMVAMISAPGHSKYVSMHRTYLAPGGKGKAEMDRPKRLMPGSLPDGSCVMLGEYVPGGPLGVAEGIETALAASAMFQMPVWAALSSAMLAKWVAPEGCSEVVIFGDNDPKFGGQAAAYHLAHRLAVRGVDTTVSLPAVIGEDWHDVYVRGLPKAASGKEKNHV